jgi:hypothetical protein
MDTICIAICSKGLRCEKSRKTTVGDGTRCGIHHNSLIKFGPHTTARRELDYVNKKEIADFTMNHIERKTAEIQQGVNNDTIWLLEARFRADLATMKARQGQAVTDLVQHQREEIHRTGVNPDAPARERDRLDRIRRDEAWRQRADLQRRVANMINDAAPVAPQNAPQQGPRQLREFVADPQNVHTTEAVQQTKDIVATVRKIPVPEGYRWNTRVVSKTIGEIIAECELNAHAAAQMFNQYVSNVSVYDIEEGIYGKVLDSVWQYVKASPDRQDLCKILKNEMTDNIGMCAQGNLSRICNILAGYMEGVGAQESLSERLGRLLAPLMELDDVSERIRQACVILSENKVSHDEWSTWMDPLLEEGFQEFYELMREQLLVA